MKNILFSILLISLCTIRCEWVQAQAYCLSPTTDPCCNGIISTGIPFAQNDERATLKNNFDWTTEYWKVYLQAASSFRGDIKNPFYSKDFYLSNINFNTLIGIGDYPTKADLDFKPSDGWELVHKYDGYLPDQVTIEVNGNNDRTAPHVILYNKYRGLLRIVAGMPAGVVTGTNQILVELNYNQYNNGLAPSGLFNKMQAPIKALDVQSEIVQFVKAATPAVEGNFIVADFLMNYDPCVCNSQNYFRVNFSTITKLDISLGGRLIGTSVPLEADGNAMLLNNRNDFLTAVATNGNNVVNNGALTYANIDKLAQQYKAAFEPKSTDPVGDFFFNTLKNGLVSGITSLGKSGDDELNKQASVFYETQFGGEELLTLGSKILTLPKKLNLGLAVVSQGAKMLGGILFPEKEKPSNPIPLISFIEAEMVLSGTAIGKAPINGGTDILFAIPGSKYSTAPAKTPDASYPTYNEPLGLFSLLETPKGVVRYDRATITKYGGYNVGAKDPFSEWGTESLTFQLDKSSIKYAFNPSAEIDLDNTKIYASLELEEVRNQTIFDNTFQKIQNVFGCPALDDQYSDSYACSILKGIKYTSYGEFVPNMLAGTGATQKYTTNIMPLECLAATSQSISFDNLLFKQFTTTYYPDRLISGCPSSIPSTSCFTIFPSYFNNDKKMVLKLHIDYVFKKNKYGKINRYFEILTYPVSVSAGVITNSYANNTKRNITVSSLNKSTYHPAISISAWNTITVNSTVYLYNPPNLDDPTTVIIDSYHAGDTISFVPGAEVSGNVEFVIDTKNICSDKILPVSNDDIKTFCTSKYFAKSFVSLREGNDLPFNNQERSLYAKEFSFNVFPNPIVSSSIISYTVPEMANVRLYVSDILGNPVSTLVDEQTHSSGSYQKILNAETLGSPGTYFCSLEINGQKSVQRLVVVK